MPTIERRRSPHGPRYRVRVRLRGLRPLSKTFSTLHQARQWGMTTESTGRMARDLPLVEAARHTLAELLDRYRREVLPRKSPGTQRNHVIHLHWWQEALGHLIISTPRPGVAIGDVGIHALASPGGVLPAVEGLPGVTVAALHDEHLVLHTDGTTPLTVGDQFLLHSGQQDILVNRWDRSYGTSRLAYRASLWSVLKEAGRPPRSSRSFAPPSTLLMWCNNAFLPWDFTIS